MFGLFKSKSTRYFSEEENQRIVAAIQKAEQRTSGEVRIYVEKRCRYVDPVLRALEIFLSLKMTETAQRNGVLIYLAMKDRQLAVYGDEGIHSKVGYTFWNEEVKTMLQHFNKENYVDGIVQIIHDIGEVLVQHFPYDGKTDKNELPDDIVFGR
jgi:uncharacterized membrane protein